MISSAPLLQIDRGVISTINTYSLLPLAIIGATGVVSFTTAIGANTAGYFPFFVESIGTFSVLAFKNGNTIAGNIDLGIYNGKTFAKLVSTGSTEQAGASSFQEISVSSFTLTPGFYYFAYAGDTGTSTGTFYTIVGAHFSGLAGVMVETSAFPLPTTATPIYTTTQRLPLMYIR